MLGMYHMYIGGAITLLPSYVILFIACATRLALVGIDPHTLDTGSTADSADSSRS